MCSGPVLGFCSHPDEKSVRFKSKFATRIFAVKIRVLNFEILRTRIFAAKIRVANSEMHRTRIFALRIRIVNFEIFPTYLGRWKSLCSQGRSYKDRERNQRSIILYPLGYVICLKEVRNYLRKLCHCTIMHVIIIKYALHISQLKERRF